MSITISQIQTAGNQFRRATETVELTAAKALEAAALAVEDIHSQARMRFTQRRQTFDYLLGETDYSMSFLNIPDFRDVKDLRSLSNDYSLDYVDNNYFAYIIKNGGRPCYTIENLDGEPVLRIYQEGSASYQNVNEATSYDGNGTWTADTSNSDALNVRTDNYVYKRGGGSVAFDVDVSQSENNRATIYNADMDEVDLSAFKDQGIFRLSLYIPDTGDDSTVYVTSVELRWGNDDSNYWTKTITKPVDNARWQDRWNRCEFKWHEATAVGSPDASEVDYLLVTVNYSASQTDDTSFRINDIRIWQPEEMAFIYFSKYTVKATSTGLWKQRATVTTDELLCDDVYKEVYIDAYNWFASRMLFTNTDNQVTGYEKKYRGQYDARKQKWVGGSLERIVTEQGERKKMPLKKLTPPIRFNND